MPELHAALWGCGTPGMKAVVCVLWPCQPWWQFPVLWGTVQMCHQEHLKNTCACHRKHYSAAPSSTKPAKWRGNWCWLGEHCTTEWLIFNSLKNLTKLMYRTSATPPYYLGSRYLFDFLTWHGEYPKENIPHTVGCEEHPFALPHVRPSCSAACDGWHPGDKRSYQGSTQVKFYSHVNSDLASISIISFYWLEFPESKHHISHWTNLRCKYCHPQTEIWSKEYKGNLTCCCTCS